MHVNSDHPSEWMVSGPGATRRILSENEELMMVEFKFEKGGAGLPHNHSHVQSTYVQSGRFEFTISEVTKVVNVGDAFMIPSNAIHSCKCLEAGTLIDSFTPRRDDFLEAHGKA